MSKKENHVSEMVKALINLVTKEVELVKGDTLWHLAEEHLGDGNRWRELYILNSGVIYEDQREFREDEVVSETLIFEGKKLRVPTF